MISIIRVGSSPEAVSGCRIIDALNNNFTEMSPQSSIMRKFIIIKKIDPEEYEDDYGVEDMTNEEDFELSQKELDDIEAEIPPEVDEISDEDIDIDDDELDDEPETLDNNDLDDIEAEIPSEVDELPDESDGELDDDI